MKKADRTKLLIIFGISLMFSWLGCVETDVSNLPSTVDFRSQFKIVNLSTVVPVSAVSIYDANGVRTDSVQLALGDEYPAAGQPYKDIASGSKTVLVYTAGSATPTLMRFAINVNKIVKLYITNPDSATVNINVADMRDLGQTKATAPTVFIPDTAAVVIINATTDLSIGSVVIAELDSTISYSTAIGPSKPDQGVSPSATDPILVKAGNYNFIVRGTADDTLATVHVTAAAQSRYAAALYGTSANGTLSQKVFTDD